MVACICVASDASGHCGCGAWSQKSWFLFQWPVVVQQSHKELFAVLLAVAAWGNRWRGMCVQWFCYNQAAVHAVSSRSCRDAQMMRLVRSLFFFEAWFDFQLIAAYLPGVQNDLAYDLSRDRLSSFLSKVQSPDLEPARLHPELPALLLEEQGWTSPAWTTIFTSTVTEA